MLATALVLSALVAGCRGPERDRDPDRITFTRHIAPIIFARCSQCHRPHESAPFSLLGYRDVQQRAQQIAQVTGDRFMPPWLPAMGELEFRGERGLSAEQIDTIRLWVKQGAVEGDRADLPPAPEWTEGWQLGEPDLVVESARPFTLPAEGLDVYRNFVIPIPVDRTHFVRTIELRPGNKRIVHHAIIRTDRSISSRRLDEMDAEPGFGGMEMGNAVPPDGQFLGWTPGRVPDPGSDAIAWRLDPGTDLVLQLHMLPTGKPETIRPRVGLFFAEHPPTSLPFAIVLDSREIDIPPGVDDYVIRDEIVLPVPVEVLGLYPHAHYLGKIMVVTATLPDGTSRTLLRIDDWDFNWQDDYRYARPLPLPAGTTISMRYTYDNSAANPRNPNSPPLRVVSGNRSTDEMGTLTIQLLPRGAEGRLRLQEAQARHTLTKEPDDYASHNNLGNALLELGRVDEAVGHLRQATRIRPDLDDAHYNLGVALAGQGRQRDALECYREALRINPVFAPAENNLGNALLALGHADEAIAHYRAALRLQPDFRLAHYNLGNAYLDRDRLPEAIASYREALRIDPAIAMTYNNLAVALQTDGQHDEALKLFRRALEVDAELADAHRNLGVVLAGRGRTDEAIVHFREALRIRPDDAVARRHLDESLEARRQQP